MQHVVDFHNVSMEGLHSSSVAEALAGLRANEARYFKNKYDHVFAVSAAVDATETVERMARILPAERNISIASRPLEATSFDVDVPDELASSFKFARQKSKFAGVTRGSYFVIKGEY